MKKRAIYLALGCLMSLIFIFTSCDKKKKEPIPAPSGLKYVPSVLDALEGYPKQSAVPTISSSEDVSWKITSVPDHGGNITIDEKGVIGTKAELPIGDYVITVYASNSGGETEFPSAFTVKVSAPIAPTKLEYPPVGAGAANTLSVTRGQITFASPVPVTKGAALTFSILTTEPAEVKNYLSINPSTGVITIADPKLPAGTHKITVEIANELGKIATILTLEVKPSVPPANLKYTPNVSDPTKTPEGGQINSPKPTLDVVDGYQYEFKIVAPMNPDIKIDASTGVLTILPDLAKNDYVIDVSVSNKVDAPVVFKSAYTFKIGDPAKPTFVTYTPSTLVYTKNAGYTFEDHEAKSDGTKLTYTFTATSKSGMNKLSDWTGIDSKTGKLSIQDFLGIAEDEYTVEVTATNSQGFSAKGTVLAIVKPEVAITNLQYPNAPAEINFGTAFNSGLPTVMGPGVRKDVDAFTIAQIMRDGNMYSNNFDFWMDDNTNDATPRGQYGQVKTVNDLPPGEYKLLVWVKNAITTFPFNDIIVFKVKGGANPPMTLTYPAISTPTATTPILMIKTKSGAMFSSGMPMITGGTPTKYYYRVSGLPAGTPINGITINSTTGEITADGTIIGDKDYVIEVRAANNDGLALAKVIVAYDKTYFYKNPYTDLEVGGVYEMLIATCSQNPMLCHGNASARKMGGTEVPNYLRYLSAVDNVIDYAKGMTNGTLATPATNSFLDRMMISPTDPMRSTKRMPINLASTNPDDIALLKKWVTDGMPQGVQPTAWPASDP